jgi:hypothetical protein
LQAPDKKAEARQRFQTIAIVITEGEAERNPNTEYKRAEGNQPHRAMRVESGA